MRGCVDRVYCQVVLTGCIDRDCTLVLPFCGPSIVRVRLSGLIGSDALGCWRYFGGTTGALLAPSAPPAAPSSGLPPLPPALLLLDEEEEDEEDDEEVMLSTPPRLIRTAAVSPLRTFALSSFNCVLNATNASSFSFFSITLI